MISTTTIIDWLPVLKWLWVIVCFLCWLVSVFSAFAAYRDAHVVKRAVYDHYYRLQAWQTFRHEGVLCLFQLIVLVIRGWAISWPSPRYPSFATDWSIDATLITLAQIMLAISSLIDLRDRHRMLNSPFHSFQKWTKPVLESKPESEI